MIDPSGNSMTYTYARETNRYGYENAKGVLSYVRGGSLRSIEYGTRAGAESGDAPAKVVFGVAERCLATADFDCAASKLTSANKAHWPDVPFDRICTSSTACASQTVPTFFSRLRTTTVTTQILTSGGTYRSVDRWDLTQEFPDPGDGTDPALWLQKVTHVGLGTSTSVTLPATTFVGEQMPNRVDARMDDRFPMNRYRISSITAESGAVTSVNYSSMDCTPSSLPTSPQTNARRCMPVYWTPEGATDQVLEYFHKYVVTSVVENSRDTFSEPVETHYSYVGDAAWHYDEDDLVRPKYRTWSQWRGYGTVDVNVGAPGVSGEPQVHTRYRYFRGMHGDRSAPSGGTRTEDVDGITDYDQFAGVQREQISYNGSAEVESVASVPWRSSATATNVDGDQAFHTGVTQTDTTTTLSGGNTRTARQVTTFDSYGSPSEVDDLGDVAIATDDRCTRTTYGRNTAKNILDTVQRTETVAVKCATTPSRPTQVISDQRFAYDGAAVGTAPTIGRVTLSQEADKYVSGAASYVTAETTTYDAFGRPTSVSDALARTTTTSYTDTAGLTTGATVTTPDPDGTGTLTALKTTTVLDPAWGTPTKTTDANGKITTGTYDALGRLTQVWEPGRVQGTDTPTTKFAYAVRSSGVNAVTTQTLNHDGSAYVSSSVIYDGMLRQRQSQSPSADRANAGRLVTDTLYDSRGLVDLRNEPWFTTGSVATTVVATNDAKPGSTVITYDAAGRATKEEFRIAGTPQWATTTSYGGDRVVTNPPSGGTATVTISDARGRTSVQRQFLGDEPSGSFQDTKYTYDAADRLIGVTDPADNDWTYGYDLRGRQTISSDPDKGTTATTYDDAGQVTTTEDARGEVLAYTYDALGRKTSMRDDTTSGAIRAQWTYDTVAKGQLTTSVRNDAGVAYTLAVTGYDDHYRPLGQTVTVPSTQGNLAGSYTTKYTYTVDGRLKTMEQPAVGGLSAETVTTYYDAANQAEWMGGSFPNGTYVAGTAYSPYGELLKVDMGGNYVVQANWAYEQGSRRLIQSWIQREGASAFEYDTEYSYDDAGNVLRVADTPGAGRAADVQCFDYDGLRRMTEAWTQASGSCAASPSTSVVGGAAQYWTSYEFDKVGNRTQVVSHATTTGATDTTLAYAYPAAGAAKAHAVSSVTASGGSSGASTYGYDAAGNMTSRAVAGKTAQTLSWDAEGELSKVTEGSATTGQYVYTADGERLLRTEGGKATLYLPGGTEVTASGSVLSAQRYYQFNGQTVAVRTGAGTSGTTTIVADHHGTGVVQVAQATNTMSRRYTDPYGQARGAAATWTGDRGFLDKTQDATGLVQVGARYYDPLIGRFVSVDPVMDLSDPQQWNAYSYSNNNPLTWSDPSGEIPIGAGHVGYNPKQKNDPRKYDTCTRSTSCVKKESQGGAPVRVRYNYTETARSIFSRSKYRNTSYTVNRTEKYYAASRVAAKSGLSQFGRLSRPRVGPAQIKPRPRVQSDSSGDFDLHNWARQTFTTADGIEQWTDTGSKWAGYISLGGLAIEGIGVAAGASTCVVTLGGGCIAGAAVAGFGAAVASGAGWVSTGLSVANGFANYKLGRTEDGHAAMASAFVGAVTGGAGSGFTHLAQDVGGSSYVVSFILGTGGWATGETAGNSFGN
ncbi:MAG TPA: RHS repeat-associated core domain-containing protein [Mycobacterium sp.]